MSYRQKRGWLCSTTLSHILYFNNSRTAEYPPTLPILSSSGLLALFKVAKVGVVQITGKFIDSIDTAVARLVCFTGTVEATASVILNNSPFKSMALLTRSLTVVIRLRCCFSGSNSVIDVEPIVSSTLKLLRPVAWN